MATQGFAPLGQNVLSGLTVNGGMSMLSGFNAFAKIVTDLQLWVEGNYSGLSQDKEFQTKANPLKGEVLADEGNLAWAWAQIDTEVQDWFAYSTNSAMPQSKVAKKYLAGMVGSVKTEKTKEPNFGWLQGGTITINHTEPKLLVQIQDEFDLDPNKSQGYIIIVSSRDVCSSCRNLIHRFATAFPHIIIYGVGLGQIGQGQKDVPQERQISSRMRSGSISQDLPAIATVSASHKPLQVLCFVGASIYGGVFTQNGVV